MSSFFPPVLFQSLNLTLTPYLNVLDLKKMIRCVDKRVLTRQGQTLCTSSEADSRAWWPHNLHYYHHSLQRWSPHLSLDDLEDKSCDMTQKEKWVHMVFLWKCFVLPCSDGLTIPLLAKRASSAGGRGILQPGEQRRKLTAEYDGHFLKEFII